MKSVVQPSGYTTLKFLKCGQGRIRTADTCIFSAVLYQLSYLARSSKELTES